MGILEADLTMEERAWYLRAVEQFGWSKLTLQKKIAEAAHLTEDLDLTSEMCYTEHDKVAAGIFAQKNRGGDVLSQSDDRYRQKKYLNFVRPVYQQHMGREPP